MSQYRVLMKPVLEALAVALLDIPPQFSSTLLKSCKISSARNLVFSCKIILEIYTEHVSEMR